MLQGRNGVFVVANSASALEGAHQIATGKLESLSEQQLVDCSKENYGCNGGWPSKSFDYISQVGGIVSEHSYSYHAVQNPCK